MNTQNSCSTIILEIPLDRVKRGNNDRKNFNETQIIELARSIAKDGLAQPVTYRPVEDGMYEIVAGERRTRAHWYLQEHGITYTNNDGEEITIPPNTITTIPTIVRDLDDQTTSNIMLAENTGRVDLNPIEEAEAYQSRIDEYKYTPEQIAEIASVNVERVKRRLSLLTLIPEVQHLVRHDNMPLGHAELMVKLDADRQRIVMRIFAEAPNGLTMSKFKHIVNDLLSEQQTQSLFDLEAFWVQQVQQDIMPRRGKKAFIPAPTSQDLPPVKRNVKWGASDIMDQYIADLLKSGHPEAAAALGNVYHTLVRHNYMSVPEKSAIDPSEEEFEVHEETGQDHRL